MSIHASHAFVLEQAKANIEFIRASPSHIGQAKQVNTALANIVAMERNMVMHKALERAIRNDNENLPRLPEH
jgi:hypothetical protein